MTEATAVDSSTVVIEARNLCKDRVSNFLRKHYRVLDGLNLQVSAGTTFGLVGPNGAGKTTTIKLLLGLLRPDGGTAQVLGKDAGNSLALQQIGYLPETPYFYSHLTGREFLDFSGNLFGLDKSTIKSRSQKLLERVSLQKAADERTGKYSKGMLQRLGIAQALINEPQILFLDEPMSGLDPLGRMDMRKILLELKAEGRTIFFNSHLLPDVALLCDRVGVLNKGKLVAESAMADITSTGNVQVLEEYFLQHTRSEVPSP